MVAVNFSISVDIDAPRERVWAIMSDIERWSEWTASVTRIRQLTPGPMAVGTRALVRQPKLPPAFWKVVSFEPNEAFTWVTWSPGVSVTARHSVQSTGSGSRATLSLQFAGLLGPMLARLTRDLNDRYLALEAAGLKRRSEGA
jgi:uncharacterized protein YndB with AHSA1/START domain